MTKTTKAKNPVAKNASAAIGGGAAGAHKDKKKAMKQGDVKHKKAEFAESYEARLTRLLKEATVNSQFINVQVTKILAREAQRMTNAPIEQLLAPLMKEYNLTLQQINSMVPGGLKKAAGQYGVMVKGVAEDTDSWFRVTVKTPNGKNRNIQVPANSHGTAKRKALAYCAKNSIAGAEFVSAMRMPTLDEQGVAEGEGIDPKIQFLQPTIQFAEKMGYKATLNPQGRVVAKLVNKQLGHIVHIGLMQPSGKGFEVSMADNLDKQTNAWSAKELAQDFKGWYAQAVKDQDFNNGYNEKPQLEQQGVVEGPTDGKEDNFTIDDIKNLEKIRDFETLKAHAKELIKGKPARRMKPEKISWFYNHIDTLKNPLAVIKMMYDLMLAGEGHKVIGSRNSMSSNSYRTKFGEQGVAEGEGEIPPEDTPEYDQFIRRGGVNQKSPFDLGGADAYYGRQHDITQEYGFEKSSPEWDEYIQGYRDTYQNSDMRKDYGSSRASAVHPRRITKTPEAMEDSALTQYRKRGDQADADLAKREAARKKNPGAASGDRIKELEKRYPAKEGWTHDSLADRLFEHERTYEEKLQNQLNKLTKK